MFSFVYLSDIAITLFVDYLIIAIIVLLDGSIVELLLFYYRLKQLAI